MGVTQKRQELIDTPQVVEGGVVGHTYLFVVGVAVDVVYGLPVVHVGDNYIIAAKGQQTGS